LPVGRELFTRIMRHEKRFLGDGSCRTRPFRTDEGALSGNRREAQVLADELQRSGQPVSVAMALYFLLCNELDSAADWVEKAVETRDEPSPNTLSSVLIPKYHIDSQTTDNVSSLYFQRKITGVSLTSLR